MANIKMLAVSFFAVAVVVTVAFWQLVAQDAKPLPIGTTPIVLVSAGDQKDDEKTEGLVQLRGKDDAQVAPEEAKKRNKSVDNMKQIMLAMLRHLVVYRKNQWLNHSVADIQIIASGGELLS